MKTLLWIGLVLLVFYIGYRIYRTIMLSKGLNKLMEKGAIILDVRTDTEFKTGHIDGSINISLGSLRSRYTELDTSKTYITTCSHGLRSVKAESILKERGFRHVYNGGAWSDLEKIVEKSESPEDRKSVNP